MNRRKEDDSTTAERIARLQQEWDALAASPDDVELTREQCEELTRRLAHHRLNPTRYKTWGELRSELLALSRDHD